MSSLLRTRLIEDLRIRNYSKHTIKIYVRCVAEFANFVTEHPKAATEEHLKTGHSG
jgi:hypothetical protein